VPPELYNLTDLLIGDLECAREVAQGIIKTQLNIEGYHLEELRESLRSTRMHYTTIDAPRGVKILEDIIDNLTSVLATAFTSPISMRVIAVNLAEVCCMRFVLGTP